MGKVMSKSISLSVSQLGSIDIAKERDGCFGDGNANSKSLNKFIVKSKFFGLLKTYQLSPERKNQFSRSISKK
jgi:hypothetical protein